MIDSPVTFTVAYPETLSRGKLLLKTFFGWLYVGIPHGFLLFFYAIGAFFVIIAAWFAILFTGRIPRGMFDYLVGLFRWQMRVNAYWVFLTDSYPPFTGKE